MSLLFKSFTAAQDACDFKVGDLVEYNNGYGTPTETGIVARIFGNMVDISLSHSGNRFAFNTIYKVDVIRVIKRAAAKDAAEVRVGGKVMITKGSFAGQNGVVTTANGDIFKVKLSSGGEYGFRAEQIRAYDEAEAAKDAACDATEIQRVEKLLGRELTDAEFWKLGEYCTKNMKVGKSFTDAELLKAVKDSAAACDAGEFLVWGNAISKAFYYVQTAKKVANVVRRNLENEGNKETASYYANEIIPFLQQAESKLAHWTEYPKRF